MTEYESVTKLRIIILATFQFIFINNFLQFKFYFNTKSYTQILPIAVSLADSVLDPAALLALHMYSPLSAV